jgi:DNA-binding MarR family transcriptional regulator
VDLDLTEPGTVPKRVQATPSWLLARASARAHKLLVEHLSGVGVRPYHYRLLATLEETGQSSQADLGRAAHIDRSDVVAALKELETAGLVTRAPDPRNRRRNIVTLTPDGRHRLSAMHAALSAAQQAILDPLTATEQDELVGLLTRLTAAGQET